jgi:hypothetical protein
MGNMPCVPERGGCDRGQTCIVYRRLNDMPVEEDTIFDGRGIPRRTRCTELFSNTQQAALSGAPADGD